MIILTRYNIVFRDDVYRAVSDESHFCPFCHGPLKVRDSKRRNNIQPSGEVHIFLLRRLKCQNCGRLHVEMPDLFIPYKHYSREAIEQAVYGSPDFCIAENSTIYRWNKELKKSE